MLLAGFRTAFVTGCLRCAVFPVCENSHRDLIYDTIARLASVSSGGASRHHIGGVGPFDLT